VSESRLPAAPAPRRICLRLAYDGTGYSGWQAQPGRSTVQGALAAAIHAISGETVLPRGTSRTDAGVHACDQIVTFATSSRLDAGVWRRALDAHLPPDITVREACDVAADFDPLAAVVAKRYRYRVHDAPAKPVLTRPFVWRWRGCLDCGAMQAAGERLIGRHDFTSFETTPSTRRSKVRTIMDLGVRRCEPPAGEDREVWIEVEGDGFLHNMVRIIAGSLVMVGAGRRPPEWLAAALAARCRVAAGPTAPPQGLRLVATRLDPDPFPGTA
jgi:tRNA pseudouridine38-40 synthase